MATHEEHIREPAGVQSTEEALRVYERYGKPLEAEHSGEFLAVSEDGETLVGADLLAVSKQATETFGPGNIVFKIGEIAVGRWLWRRERPLMF